ncbi:MAG: ribosomal protein S18-alanine N-acetyltransferase [Gemmatimonadota bacterium]
MARSTGDEPTASQAHRRESERIRIRRARSADLPRVVELERISFSTPWTLASFHSLLDRDGVSFLVVESPPSPVAGPVDGSPRGDSEDAGPGEILGYGILWAVGREAELADLAVDPRARRRGIGGALLDALLDRARDRGVERVFLEVRDSNSAAHSLYRRRGFRQVGVRTQYYTRPVENARVLRLDLTGEGSGLPEPHSTPEQP